MITRIEKLITFFLREPNSASPTIEVSAKNNNATATNIAPHVPKCSAIAIWVRVMPSAPSTTTPESKIIRAVAVQTKSVSTNTPNACTRPWMDG